MKKALEEPQHPGSRLLRIEREQCTMEKLRRGRLWQSQGEGLTEGVRRRVLGPCWPLRAVLRGRRLGCARALVQL